MKGGTELELHNEACTSASKPQKFKFMTISPHMTRQSLQPIATVYRVHRNGIYTPSPNTQAKKKSPSLGP